MDHKPKWKNNKLQEENKGEYLYFLGVGKDSTGHRKQKA